VTIHPKTCCLLQYIVSCPSAIQNSTSSSHQMTPSNKTIHRNNFSVGMTTARGSSNHIHAGNMIRHAERSKPFDVTNGQACTPNCGGRSKITRTWATWRPVDMIDKGLVAVGYMVFNFLKTHPLAMKKACKKQGFRPQIPYRNVL